MDGWTDPEAAEGTGSAGSGNINAAEGPTFDDESECVVCYDNAIDTCLRPCGHQALCRACADQLRGNPKKCPLCRAVIEVVAVSESN
jgi:hypothetical protein